MTDPQLMYWDFFIVDSVTSKICIITKHGQILENIWRKTEERSHQKNDNVVKILFGWVLQIYFKLQVIYKLYRQVLTSSKNSQLLLKLEILDKFRLVTKQWYKDKGNCYIF